MEAPPTRFILYPKATELAAWVSLYVWLITSAVDHSTPHLLAFIGLLSWVGAPRMVCLAAKMNTEITFWCNRRTLKREVQALSLVDKLDTSAFG
jgi:hypothetical protein